MELTKETLLSAFRRAPGQGWKVAEITTELSLDDGKTRHRLRRLLQELQEAGELERAPGARYRLPGTGDTVPHTNVRPPPPVPADAEEEAPRGKRVTGSIRVHPAGYGFVVRDDAEDDVFVPARHRGTAMDGDRVAVVTWLGYKGTEGRVVEVVERGRAKLTGTIKHTGWQVYLEPDDPRIASQYGHVHLDDGAEGARDGQAVVAEITRYPTGTQAEGQVLHARVAKILGSPDDPRTEVEKVIALAEIPDDFPEDVLVAARRTPPELTAPDFADRVDLRDRPFLTIDPINARDFDDAVYLEERAGGFRLWVAVADVSHYVRVGTALDREARIRGCSVYLPNRAISMLPKELSAGICSLNPEVDRCAMVARIDLDAHGVAHETHFTAAVIRSHARLDYDGVAAALRGDFRGPRARYEQWKEDLHRMHALSRKMRALRAERGSLDFDVPEARVVLDEDDPRLVRDVIRSKANPDVKEAYQLVEEFMLAANEAVARYFSSRDLDTVWRVHAQPSTERLGTFAALAEGFGVEFDAEEGTSPKEVRKVLQAIAGKPYERALSFLLLRSLKQAVYDVVNIGHFGLASTDYLHFTSPIRRYPDLIVHRLLKYWLRKEGLPSGGPVIGPPPPRDQLAAMAQESSQHERRAVEAEREVTDMYRAFLMRDRVGDELEGIVSGVTHFGLFIEVNEPFVEGLIKTDQLGDEPFFFEEASMRLRGKRTGRVFALGDRVKVKVENVSVPRRQIDLSLVEGGVVDEAGAYDRPARGERPQRRGGEKEQPRGHWGGKKRRPPEIVLEKQRRGDRREADQKGRDRREPEQRGPDRRQAGDRKPAPPARGGRPALGGRLTPRTSNTRGPKGRKR